MSIRQMADGISHMRKNANRVEKGGWSAYFPAIVLMVIMLGFGVVGIAKAPETGEMAVVFSPLEREEQQLARIVAAGAFYVGPSRLRNVQVIKVQDADVRKNLRALGAWFFVAADGLCAPIELANAAQ